MEFKVETFPDGRLMVLWIFNKAPNFRKHENGSYSYCPSEKDIDLVKKTYEAINEYNERIVLDELSIPQQVAARNDEEREKGQFRTKKYSFGNW